MEPKKKPVKKVYIPDDNSGDLKDHNLNPSDNTIVDDFKEAFMPKGARSELQIKRRKAGYQ